jgi:hypothetical protein
VGSWLGAFASITFLHRPPGGPPVGAAPESPDRHCEEQSDEAIHSFFVRQDGLLRFARNDDLKISWLFET